MPRVFIVLAAVILLLPLGENGFGQDPAANAPIDDDPRISAAFLQGLRDRGYFDLAIEYLERLKASDNAPEEILSAYDYEVGRMLLDEATKTGDYVRRRDLFDQARTRLDSFAKSNPTHPKAPDANVQLARLLLERGHMAMVQADEAKDAKEKESKLGDARTNFDQSKAAYGAAETFLVQAFDKYPKFLPDTDPRLAERERTHNSLMESQLQKAVADYEKAQTYPLDSPPRKELLAAAFKDFEGIYQKYRTQFAGLSARMWEGKCYEESGDPADLGKAMGIYNELMQHPDPRVAPLQRHVGYFRIIVEGKRKEYALAADESVRWLAGNSHNKIVLRSPEGLGVQLELAKNLIAQLPGAASEREKDAVIKRAVEQLSNVVKYSSRFKSEALALLREYKPSAAANAGEIGKLDYEGADAQAQEAIAVQEWPKAAALLRQAIRRAEMLKDMDKINYSRYHLAFVDYSDKRYYEAAVLAEHIAMRYPRNGLASKAAEIAMAAYSEAYNSDTSADRTTDLKKLIEIAKFIAEAFNETEQGDKAKLTLGQIYQGTGEYPLAITSYQSVRANSPLWLESETRLGSTYWDLAQRLKRDGKESEAKVEIGRATEALLAALKARRDAGTSETDPGLIENVCDLADIDLDQEQPDEALKRLDPLLKANSPSSEPTYARLISTTIRARIGVNQVEQAIADMQALEKSGAGTNLKFALRQSRQASRTRDGGA